MALSVQDWTVTFEDEFDDPYLNTSIWGTKYWWGGRSLASNGELQYFADRSTRIVKAYPQVDPFKVSTASDPDGILTITANVSPKPAWTENLPYVSGMINTHGTFSQTYGYFEISAKVPSGQGLWPAFWMLPQSGDWPPEIDVLELLGGDPKTYYYGAHWVDAIDGHDFQTKPFSNGTDFSQGFHTYGALWTETSITFYLDREPIGTPLDTRSLGLDEPMYLLAGLAVGGNWGGPPNASTKFPAEFKVDYIRAWSFDSPATVQPNLKGDERPNTLETTPGNDIFWGGGSADRFAFRMNPVGQDTILDFDTAGGDLIEITKSVAGVKGFSTLYRNIQDNADGDAVLRVADGGTITFKDVTKAQLEYNDFLLV